MKDGSSDFEEIGSNDKGSWCTKCKGVKPMAGLGIPTTGLAPPRPPHALQLKWLAKITFLVFHCNVVGIGKHQ